MTAVALAPTVAAEPVMDALALEHALAAHAVARHGQAFCLTHGRAFVVPAASLAGPFREIAQAERFPLAIDTTEGPVQQPGDALDGIALLEQSRQLGDLFLGPVDPLFTPGRHDTTPSCGIVATKLASRAEINPQV